MSVRRRPGPRFVLLLLLFILVGGLSAAALSPLTRVQRVSAVGVPAAPALARAAGIRRGMRLWSLVGPTLSRRVQRASPWVRSATVLWVPPRGVRVVVVGRRPRAHTPCSVGTCDLSARQMVLATRHPAGPLLVGSWPTPVVGRIDRSAGVRSGLAVVEHLPAVILPAVSEVVVSRVSEVDLFLLSGLTVRLGVASQLGRKMQALLAIWRRAQQEATALKLIDVSDPRHPAVVLAGYSHRGAHR